MSDGDGHHGTGTDTLCIVKVEKGNNDARYRCHVTNETGEKFSKEAIFKVGKLVMNVIDMCAAENFYWYRNLTEFSLCHNIKHLCLFSKLAARMGTYFRRVLIFIGC